MNSSSLPTAPPTPVLVPDVLAVQHNALVNARFGLGTLEMRLFLSMLGRIGRHDTAFKECSVPVRELAPEGSVNIPYSEVAAMVKQLARRALDIEKLGPDGRRSKEPDLVSIPLMNFASYSKSAGIVVARFNDAIRPYLLQLRDNFTKAEIKQLQKLKSVSSHRIYWLLKEYAAFGRRTVSLSELRHLLGLTKEYEGRFDHFRARVLDRAQQELRETDLPFTYELIRQGRQVVEIRFLFAPSSSQLSKSAQNVEGWESALLAVGVSAKSLAKIKTQLVAGYYTEGYITYVLGRVREQVKQGKVKKEAGAVYKALTEGYMLTDYEQAMSEPLPSVTNGKGSKVQARLGISKQKLISEIDDARNSLSWLREPATLDVYKKQYPDSPEVYNKHVTVAEEKLKLLLQQLDG